MTGGKFRNNSVEMELVGDEVTSVDEIRRESTTVSLNGLYGDS